MALLTHERDAALERQNATGEILASITGSTTDLSQVFEAIVRNLLRLFGTRFAIVTLVRDGMLVLAGFEGAPGSRNLPSISRCRSMSRRLPEKQFLPGGRYS